MGHLEANACVWSSGSSCVYNSNSLQTDTWQDQALIATGRRRIRWVQKKYMNYNYCTDLKRFPQGLHPNVRDQSSAKGTKAPSYDWCFFFFCHSALDL